MIAKLPRGNHEIGAEAEFNGVRWRHVGDGNWGRLEAQLEKRFDNHAGEYFAGGRIHDATEPGGL